MGLRNPIHADFSHVQSGDLLACLGSEWTSRFIQWKTGSPYSHVGFFMWLHVPVRRLVVCDSNMWLGVRLVPIESFTDWPGSFEHFETVGLDRKRLLESALSRWVYGFPGPSQFIRSFFVPEFVSDWFGVADDIHLRAVHCSEHVSLALQDAGVTLPLPPTKMFPGKIVALRHNGSPLFRSTGRFSIRDKVRKSRDTQLKG
jgi:hypothetical protein